MSGFYEVANWDQFQHYSKRNPPWIKLHFALLSGETWVSLDDASRVLAIACMLLASRNDGRVPANPDYLQRVAYLNQRPNFKPLIDTGFLIDASNLLADASGLHTNARPETETEKEERQNTEQRKRQSRASVPPYRWDEFAAIYPPEKLIPDARAKAWWRRHVTTDEAVSDVLAGTRAWIGSRQYAEGFVFGCCRFLTEELWRKLPTDTRPMTKGERITAHNRKVLEEVIAQEAIGGPLPF